MYVDNYNHNGLDEDWLSIAKQGKLILDPNTKALVEFFEFFERKTLGTKEEEDCRPIEQQINEQKIEHFLQTSRPEAEKLKQHLRTKLLIFNMPDEQGRDMYFQLFKMMAEHGEKWMQADHDQTYVQEFNDSEI